MNCRYVQSRLSAYLDFELSGEEQQLIRSHLEACMECSAEFESLRRTKQLLRQMPVVKPQSGAEQVLMRVRQVSPVPSRTALRVRWHPPRFWQYAGGFALVAALIFLGRTDDSELPPMTAASPLPTYTTPSADPLLPAVAPELSSVYNPYPSMLFRRASNPLNEPTPLMSVSMPMGSTLGYQSISDWSSVEPQPKFIETHR